MKTYEVHGKYKKSDQGQGEIFNLKTADSDVFAKIAIGYDQGKCSNSCFE